MAKQYRKKPVVIEAMLWDGTATGAGPVINWILDWDGTATWRDRFEPNGNCIRIATLEGVMTASPGDYIIRGVQGEFYPCKPDIFEATYDEVV